MRIALLALALTACSSGTFVVGDVDGQEFSGKTKAFYGISHLIVVDEADCIDLAWVDNRYYDGINPWEGRSFVGLQFTERTGANLSPGVYGFGTNSPIRAYGLVGSGDDFDAHPGREGSVEVVEVNENTGKISGNFEVSFTNSSVAGEFEAEFCINMQ